MIPMYIRDFQVARVGELVDREIQSLYSDFFALVVSMLECR